MIEVEGFVVVLFFVFGELFVVLFVVLLGGVFILGEGIRGE